MKLNLDFEKGPDVWIYNSERRFRRLIESVVDTEVIVNLTLLQKKRVPDLP